jgi:thioredoxin 1
MAAELTDSTFDEVVKSSDVPVLVDFWAEWCGPCKQVAPVLDELASDHEGKLLVGKLDIDENLEVTARYGVQSIPTLILFKDGEVAERIVGARGKAFLNEKLAGHL